MSGRSVERDSRNCLTAVTISRAKDWLRQRIYKQSLDLMKQKGNQTKNLRKFFKPYHLY